MRLFALALSLIYFTTYATAGGLSDPEVVPGQILSKTNTCNNIRHFPDYDFKWAYLHYSVAVGYNAERSNEAALNAVKAHSEAREQTCNSRVKAVTDGNGNGIRDRAGKVVINNPA